MKKEGLSEIDNHKISDAHLGLSCHSLLHRNKNMFGGSLDTLILQLLVNVMDQVGYSCLKNDKCKKNHV